MIGGPRPSKVACCMLEQHVHAHVLAVRNLFQTDAEQQWQVTPWKPRVLKTMMTSSRELARLITDRCRRAVSPGPFGTCVGSGNLSGYIYLISSKAHDDHDADKDILYYPNS